MNLEQVRDIKFTNLDIARSFFFSIDQVRRWALVAFPADATTEWGKGKKREYNIDETFKIYLISVLCSQYNMSLSQATFHLDNIWLNLKEYNHLPSQILWGHIEDNAVFNQIYIHPGPVYDFRWIIDCETINADKSTQTYILKYKIIKLTPKEDFTKPLTPIRNTSTPTMIIQYRENMENCLRIIDSFIRKNHESVNIRYIMCYNAS